MPRASVTVVVDEQLYWVVRVPEALAGSTRASSAAQLRCLEAQFNAQQMTLEEAARADIRVEAITRAIIESLNEPPALPFIGEPFGGEDGTD